MRALNFRLLLLLPALFITDSFAQNKFTDSLKVELNRAKDDTTRIVIMTSLGANYRAHNLDTAAAYVQRAIQLSQKIKFARGEALGLQTLGVIQRYQGDFASALQSTFKGLQIAEENHFKFEIAYALTRIGFIFDDLGDHPKALRFFDRSLQILGPDQIIRPTAVAWLGKCITYYKMSQLDSAWLYATKALDNGNLMPDVISDVYRHMAIIMKMKGNKSLALHYFNTSIQAGQGNWYWNAAATYGYMAEMFYENGQLDSTIYYAKLGLENAMNSTNKLAAVRCGNILAKIYEPINPSEALKYYKIAAATKEGIFGAGNLQAIQALIAKEEARQKDLAAASAAYQAQLKQYGLLMGLVLFLIIAFILYRNNRLKHKANMVLQEQKETVERALSLLKDTQNQLIQSEKMASLGELTAGIAHEIQNPLNFVNNFSEVNSELIEEAAQENKKGNAGEVEIILKDIKDNSDKINHHGKRADAIVKGMLQHSRTSSGQKELTDINVLCDEYIRLSYHGLRAKDKSFNAKFETDFDATLPKLNVVPQDFGRVVLNLINNAFYAVNEKAKQNITEYEPTVSVITKNEGSKISISVKDNGNGIPEHIKEKIFQPFFTTKPTGQGTGLGLSLSYDIVKAHGGELKVDSTFQNGTLFTIQLNALT